MNRLAHYMEKQDLL